MDKLRIAQDNLTEIEYNMVQKYEGFKCDKLLTRIDKNIKLLQYHLSRVVISYKNNHIVIPTNSNSQGIWIDLIEGSIPIYCKIDTANRVPPIKLTIEVKEENKAKLVKTLSRKRRSMHDASAIPDELKPDWRVYVSDKFVEPNEVNSIYTFTNQTRMTIEPKGAGIFKKREQQNEFNSSNMYFNIVSQKGCTVRINARFPREEEENEGKKKPFTIGTQLKKMQQHIRDEVQARVKELLENPSGIVELNKEIAELKER